MMNPQDIREKTFEKAVFGGYDMGPVDDFLEAVAADITALYKENAVLKSKLKVLVEKIEEYRSTEDAMRMALLSAQKMSAQIENEARQKSEKLLNDAVAEVDELKLKAGNELKAEEARLAEAKSRTTKYVESMRMLCSKQLEFFDNIAEFKLGGEPIVTPAPAERGRLRSAEPREDELDDAVKSIESSVARLADEQPPSIDIAEDEPVSPVSDEPTRLFNLGDVLKEEDEATLSEFDY